MPADATTSSMWRRRLCWAVLAVFVAGFALYLAIPLWSESQAFRRQIERAARDAGFETTFSTLHVGYDLALHMANLVISVPGEPPFATVDEVTASVSVPGWFSGQPLNLVLNVPRVFVANLPSGGEGDGAPSLPIRSVVIDSGYIMTSGPEAEEEIGPLTASMEGVRAGQEARFSLEIDPRLPAIDLTGALRTGGGELIIDGLHLQWSEVPVDILADRFPTVLPDGVGGILHLSASVTGPVSRITGNGSLRVEEIRYRGDGFEASASSAALSGDAQRNAEGVRVSAVVSAEAIEGHDSTFESVIEGLVVDGTLQGTWNPTKAPEIAFGVGAASGEVLWRRVYANLKQHPVKLRGKAVLLPDHMQVNALTARVANIGTVDADATVYPYGRLNRFDARIDVPDLRPLFELAVRDPLQESYAVLAKASVEGRLNADVKYRQRNSGSSLVGGLRVTDATVSVTEPVVEGRGLTMDLPLRLGALSGPEQQPGSVSIGGMTIGSLKLPRMTAPLQVKANRIELTAPVVVPVLGGSFEVSELVATELDSPDRHASLSVTASDVGLTALTEAVGWPSLNGTITGTIPKVTVDAKQIRSDGEIRAHAFGGDIVVENLHVDQLFSSIPTLGFDLSFDGISLERLTETLEVGRISGVARGAVHDLAITHGQPVSFDAWMETVPQDGVSQRISVDAIRQLSLLGGSGGDALTQGLLSFFDEYRYSKMGFRCRLENDKFLLRGVERSEGKDYLVVGSFLPPRVNVVSHNQVISFSEMVRRLQRISNVSEEGAEEGDQK